MSLRVDGVVDLETENWSTFVVGGLLSADGVFQYSRDEDEFFDLVLAHGGELWAWNGGRYDWNWVLEHARRRKLTANLNMAGSRITRAQLEGLKLRDAAALVPMSLAQAASIAGVEVVKDTGLPCHCSFSGECDDCIDSYNDNWRNEWACEKHNCGGYCSIRVGMPEDDYQRVIEYNRRDCEATLAVLQAVMVEAERCGYELGGTIGGSSYRTAAKMLNLPKAEWEPHVYNICRRGLYGGRVQVFMPRARSGHAYDINSAYPAALSALSLPVGEPLAVAGERARRAYDNGLDGIFHARAAVPRSTYLPPLPFRLASGRVCYPIGIFTGYWTALELREAEADGASVEVLSGYTWLDRAPLFKPYMDHVAECRWRAKAEGNEGLVKWHKLFGNSCYGKLAESPEKEALYLYPQSPKLCAGVKERCGSKTCTETTDCNNCSKTKCCFSSCSKRCKSYRPIDLRGELWAAPFWKISDCGHVHWAAYLTAWTRIVWRRQALADGQGGRTMVYGDTDSIYSTAERTENIGPEFGKWTQEPGWRDFVCVGPKAYRYTCTGCKEHPEGGPHVRAKSISRITPEEFDAFLAGEPITKEAGVMGLKTAARTGNLFGRKRIVRQNRSDGVIFGDRVLRSDGRTYPLEARECERWL